MTLPRKSKQIIESEIAYCEQVAKSHFDMTLNHKTLKSQIDRLISEKIEDYYYQRFRDWLVVDLMQMRDALIEADMSARKKDKQTYRQKLDAIAEEAAGITQD